MNKKRLELVRGLGAWASAAIVVGTMIGTGIFLKPAEMAREGHTVSVVFAAWIWSSVGFPVRVDAFDRGPAFLDGLDFRGNDAFPEFSGARGGGAALHRAYHHSWADGVDEAV